MPIVKHRKIFYAISGALVALSIAAVVVFGFRLGIDFKGGSLLEVAYQNGRPDIALIKTALDRVGKIAGYSLRPTGENGIILRTPYLNQDLHDEVLKALADSGRSTIFEKRFDSIGPTLGSELTKKALLSIGLVILAITLFITFAFRKVSEPVSSWKYGVIAIVALLHDVFIPVGAFAVLGAFAGFEIDALFVTALLVVLGFSVHDTIVVFDRVRENLRRNKEFRRNEPFEETVGRSLSQTIVRSINTSLTTVLALVALYFIGSEATRHFSLALLIGIVAGTYSSIFLASPLLVSVEHWSAKRA